MPVDSGVFRELYFNYAIFYHKVCSLHSGLVFFNSEVSTVP